MKNRRVLALGLLGLSVLSLVGCISKPLRPVNADGTYCFRVNNKSRNKTCTPDAVPTGTIEAEAKRFEPIAGSLTLYVIRKRWGDAINLVNVVVDERKSITTIPESVVRIRLTPGEHRVAVQWDGKKDTLMVSGAAGELRFVELVGMVWAWGGEYRLARDDVEASRARAYASKLIADVDLQR